MERMGGFLPRQKLCLIGIQGWYETLLNVSLIMFPAIVYLFAVLSLKVVIHFFIFQIIGLDATISEVIGGK